MVHSCAMATLSKLSNAARPVNMLDGGPPGAKSSLLAVKRLGAYAYVALGWFL